MDIMNNVLKYSAAMKAIPDLSEASGAFDFVHIDTVSHSIVDEILGNLQSARFRPVFYIHQSVEITVPVDRLKYYLWHVEEDPFRVVRMED